MTKSEGGKPKVGSQLWCCQPQTYESTGHTAPPEYLKQGSKEVIPCFDFSHFHSCSSSRKHKAIFFTTIVHSSLHDCTGNLLTVSFPAETPPSPLFTTLNEPSEMALDLSSVSPCMEKQLLSDDKDALAFPQTFPHPPHRPFPSPKPR